MNADDPTPDAARACLVAELDVLRARLRGAADDPHAPGTPDPVTEAERALVAARARCPGATPLDLVADGFGLSTFERSVVLLAAGPELVSAVRDELEVACGRPRPSFGLALRLLPDAHWDAATPTAPLRRWRLVRLDEPGSPMHSSLAVDERVLHHLAGAGHLDAEVAVRTRTVPVPTWLPAPWELAADAVARSWRQERVVLLHGPQAGARGAVAATAAARSGLRLLAIRADDVPDEPPARDGLVRLMERETVLGGYAWALDVRGGRAEDADRLPRALAGLDAPLVVLADDVRAGGVPDFASVGSRPGVPVAVPRLERAQRRDLWDRVLARHGLADDPVPAEELDAVAGVFDLDLDAVEDAAAEIAGGGAVWDACRRAGRAAFGGLARLVTPRASWDDLVLPDPQRSQLRALVAALRHRHTVLDDWGFGARSRGVGTTALFAGPSGTGKSLAGEVVAGAVGLDLVHVDLSQVLSKYIGETEKNLGRLFDAAEDAAAVLLFDEADALFGRRSEVRDSHDRYANLEVGYLLQRMEEFRGLAILTTNHRSALDPAFLRRLHTVVSFPYPDPQTRRRLWRIAVPPTAPTHDLDPARLSEIDLPGGGIAAAALTAAYLAAEEGGPLRGEHVRQASRWELAKSGRVPRSR
ncbi:ATP-binding protein [Actinomycetospora flava]|uniref:ATP-binding protein n=1 Tax=Actinomycetospora flava TaxID=3129232 RepID=A0ABU8M6A0_9PSEU